MDLIGTSIFNFIHSSDHQEFRNHLNGTCGNSKKFCQTVCANEGIVPGVTRLSVMTSETNVQEVTSAIYFCTICAVKSIEMWNVF